MVRLEDTGSYSSGLSVLKHHTDRNNLYRAPDVTFSHLDTLRSVKSSSSCHINESLYVGDVDLCHFSIIMASQVSLFWIFVDNSSR